MNMKNFNQNSFRGRQAILAVLIIPAAALLLAACATTPSPNPTLTEAENKIESLADNSRLNRLAAAELRAAQDQLARAKAVWAEGDEAAEVSHQARVAMTLADIAVESAKIGDSEQQIERLRNQRDQLRLQARAARAELQAYEERVRAEQAERQRNQAELQRSQAEAARMAEAAERSRAELERERALMQQREAEMRRQQAEEQRMLAEQRAEELERQTQQMRDEAERLQQQLVDLQAQATERGLVLTLGSDVLFDFDRDQVKTGAERTLDRIASFLNEYPERRVLIEGFTDSTGARDYNMNLSERRASSVSDALIERGVEPGRIETRGFGPDHPVASNDTEAGRQLNRRVEVVISDDDQAVPDRT